MKEWKILIEQNNVRKEITISAVSYSAAYIEAMCNNPGCKIVSISEIRPE